MKTSLDHLPEDKRVELEHVKDVLTEEFKRATVPGNQPWSHESKIMKMILFGSFSRNDWVDEPKNGYQSDSESLIIVSHQKLTVIEDYWWEAEQKLLKDRSRVKRPVNIIVHTLDEVNQALIKGEYFWVDIVKDGIMLLERPSHPLTTPQPLTPADAYDMAKKYFSKQSKHAKLWIEDVLFDFKKDIDDPDFRSHMAFKLHQTVESTYGCFLLVRTFYLPRSHNIKFLRFLSEDLDKRLIPAWPRDIKKDASRFELLKRAYVDPRYSEHFEISAQDLELLTANARDLRKLVEEACRERLEELRVGAE